MKSEKGVSLIELILVIVAVAVLAVLIAALPQSISSIRYSNNESLARQIASKELDFLQKQPYGNLSNGVNDFSDSSLSKLPSGAGNFEIDDCPAEICTNGEDIKKIKVSVNWMESGKTKNVDLFTMVSEGGLGQ
jgi:prepilin-type N-terminal cleavage/methylation domain-containing protein